MAAVECTAVCFDVVAILPAGGSGMRMNIPQPKQFCQVKERPLISYTLEAFESVSWIKEIIVPINQNYLNIAQQILSEFCHHKVSLVCGGSSRHRSIWNGIQALTADGRNPPTVVILHDAVRPFVDEQTLQSVAVTANKHGAAGVIRPLSSTVVAQSCDGFLDHSLDRLKFRSSEMPQAFQYEVIKKAYLGCTEYDFEHGTECLHLAQKYAETSAALIDGPDSLWKVTYKKDLYAVEGVLREKQVYMVVVVGTHFSKFIDELHGELDKREQMIVYLPGISSEQQLCQTMAERLASQINSKVVACTSCVSIVHVSSHESYSTADIKCFLQEISQRCGSYLMERTRLVNVRFADSKKEFLAHKMATEDLESCLHAQGVACFGVFVPSIPSVEGKDASTSRQIEKAAQLTVSAMMDVTSLFSGQTFDT